MTNQPKRIWIDAKHGQHPDDWSFYVEGDITAKDHRKAGRLPYVPEVSSTIEAPAQEPVAWMTANKSGGHPSLCSVDWKEDKDWTSAFPVYTTQPDRLALVAAAYRDAAEQEPDDVCGLAMLLTGQRENILARTPADAQAALAAIERAAYERGVKDAAATINRGGLHTSADYSDCILALLTQEER